MPKQKKKSDLPQKVCEIDGRFLHGEKIGKGIIGSKTVSEEISAE